MFFPAGQEVGSSESPQLCRQFTFSEIQLATQNFDQSLVIGHGGFGKVYKGTINNGETPLTVAIKRLDTNSNQGELEFWAEIKTLSMLRHCHLVALIGYCNDEQEMILVYEYMSYGTLDDRLHRHGISLHWVRRLKICIGAARGLDYLHTGTGIKHGVVHRDVKSTNILLDGSWEAKISDFGLSKICPKSQPSTYVNTFVRGTFGYLDPDYFNTGKLTRKSDVYAFGVVLFEVLSGKRAVDRSLDEEHWGLAKWAQDSIKEGRVKQIVDSNISGSISPKCLKEFAKLANRCLHSHPKQRPTMAEVVAGLESVLAVQEKANKTLQAAGMTIFGRKVPMPVFPSYGENSNSVGDISSKDLKLYLDTLGGEGRRLYPFDFDTISNATGNFSRNTQISPSGHTYKGTLENGLDITISQPLSQDPEREYMIAASILAKVKHENLVQLLGYSIDGTKLFLVYEFAMHGSLDLLLFDPFCTLLDWNKRYKILLGVARALLYLHKCAPIRIVHCDVKPRNILLDGNLDPKLSGFWNAMAINKTDSIDVDLITGTWGYVAPEYSNGHCSTKADVYSFGVSALETVCGCPGWHLKLERYNFLKDVGRKWLEGILSDIIDPIINVDSSVMTRFIEIRLLCVQTDAEDRPTMEEVVGMLVGSLSTTLPVSKMRARMHAMMHPTMMEEDSNCLYDVPVDDYDYDTGAVEEFISDLCPR